MKTVNTPKGTALPLVNLKGKDYLQVAHRLVWFNEAEERFRINTDFLLVTDDQTVARAQVTVFNKEGVEIKSTTATKRETKKDFPDHTEKAETGAVGRALALLGYGTQFAISDLDEGPRLADAPLVNTNTAAKAETKETVPTSAPRKLSSFRKSKATEAVPERDHTLASEEVNKSDNGWD